MVVKVAPAEPNNTFNDYNVPIVKGQSNKENPFTLLATSYKHQTREFFVNSTLHGVRYIAEKNRPIRERLMWVILTSIGAVASCIIIISLWEKFQTNPTITGLDTDFHNWDVPFPAVTICDRNPVNKRQLQEYLEQKFDNGIPSKAETFLQWLTKLNFQSLAESFNEFTDDEELIKSFNDLRDAVYNVAWRCEHVFFGCEWKSEPEECCEVILPVFTELGFCYAFNSKYSERVTPWQAAETEMFQEAFIHETDAKWSFLFNSLLNETVLDIYIHASEEMTGVRSTPQHTWERKIDNISFSVKQTYTTEDARQLTIKQRRCVFADEIILDTSPVYTYSACMRECRMKVAQHRCGCVPHFYPKILNYKWCNLTELACVGKYVEEITDVTQCACELGCTHTVYEVEKLTEVESSKGKDKNSLETEFVSWPMVRYKREVLFGWVDLLVSFGGIAGLFLGFSLLSGVEIVYYFTVRAFCAAFCTSKKEFIEELRKPKRKPYYNLGLKPWWIEYPSPEQQVALTSEGTVRSYLTNDNIKRPPNYSPPPVYHYIP